MVAIRKKGDHITVEDVQRLDAIQARLTEEETERDKHFQNAQQEFAERNNLRLRTNEIQEKIDEAN
jgi:adenylate cyclase class IV